jgi:nanoRNase/pAp phosphatase (c-di-AMP/oligoRNAs hydrolase)
MSENKYRLVTRSDFDGLICAVLLRDLNMIGEIKFVHPKDMQDGKIEISANDITTNLPYVSGAHLVFDHHLSEALRNTERPANYILDPDAPSAARVVYNYFGGATRFPNLSAEMIEAVDKADSAKFTREEVLFPKDWVLLNFIMDARTGLGRFKEFRVSNYDLMMMLIDYCKDHTIGEILAIPDVKERIDLYFEHQRMALQQIERCSINHKQVIVVDLRNQDEIYTANRFIVYAMYPECTVSIHVLWGLKQQNTVFAVGRSIISPHSKVNIGALMLEYGGGGHEKAGTCQIENDKADDILMELIRRINNNH